jgi:murein L,D-transpeptidase YafK
MTTGFLKLLLSIGFSIMQQEISFKEKQTQSQRVKDAYAEKESIVKSYFKNSQLPYRNFQVFLRAIKDERTLEIWVKGETRDTFQRLTSYAFCETSGTLGPKRKEGDLQIPEGLYYLTHFNSQSKFHLSLGINYPNASDNILSDPGKPGGAIYVHGNCVTVGCIPITDEKIKEVYLMCVEATNNGQRKIPIHIFPTRLDSSGLNKLKQKFAGAESLIKFWENLATMYEDFETSKQIRTAKVDKEGKYFH